MEIHWCWRCQMDLPMLERHEWQVIVNAADARSNCMDVKQSAFNFWSKTVKPTPQDGRDAAMRVLQDEATRLGLPTPLLPSENTAPIAQFHWHLIAGYHMFTGVLEESPDPIWHHVIAFHGPPCKECGKLLRTKRASYCVVCGTDVS